MFSSFVVWYLFLAGVGSGAYVVASAFGMLDAAGQTDRTGDRARQSQVGFIIAPVCCAFASLCLFLDLGMPGRIWEVVLTPFASIVATGTFLVVMFLAVSAAFALCGLLMKQMPSGLLWVFWVVGSVLAFGVMAYTGLLLSDMKSIEFWNTWLLPVLFIVSSLSTGAAAVIGIDVVVEGGRLRKLPEKALWRLSLVLGILEIVALAAFLGSRFALSGAAELSCWVLFTGEYEVAFWLGVAVCGLGVPLVLHAIEAKAPLPAFPLIASLGVLIGGICLRYCIVGAALFTPLSFGVFS